MFDELLNSSRIAIGGVDTYLTFDENRLVRAALTRLQSSPRSEIAGSITLIHGPAGVGKTHLARSALDGMARKQPRLKFAFATVERLCELMQQADERQVLAEFLEDCRSLDVLVCNDLEWLDQNPQAQPWFVMLIETLEEELTRILILSNRPVGELRSLDQRLVSRCHGGLCAGLPLPGLEGRVLLLQHWFQAMQLPILKPMAASARFLAERLPVSPRELRQKVIELSRLQTRKPMPIDVAYLQKWLAKDNQSPRLSFEAILHRVADEFGVDAKELRSRSRQHGLAVPRQCAMWLARDLTGRPLDQIGKYFDRSHTTVSHSLSKLNELLPTIPSLLQQVQKLQFQLKQLPREECA